jgi:Amt family ammonium transporter
LVVVTPAAGYIGPASALALGAIGAIPSYFALILRARTKLDDSLDVVAAHGVGGATGAILTGVFAEAAWSGGANGLIGGNPGQVLVQLYSVLAVLAYSGAATFGILKVLGLAMALRTSGKIEGVGLDVTEHGEEAYTAGDGAILVSPNDPSYARRALEVVAVQEGGRP